MGTILLATDGSPSAGHATGVALDLAEATGWPLRVVVAWTLPRSAFGPGAFSVAAELATAERTAAEETLAQTIERIEAAGLHAHGRVLEGDAVSQICQTARDWDARLIVIGAHGWGPLRRAVSGSVSSGVLRHAPCPVLVARGHDG